MGCSEGNKRYSGQLITRNIFSQLRELTLGRKVCMLTFFPLFLFERKELSI